MKNNCKVLITALILLFNFTTCFASETVTQTYPVTANYKTEFQDPLAGNHKLLLEQEAALSLIFSINDSIDTLKALILTDHDQMKLLEGVDITSVIKVSKADYNDVKDIIESVGVKSTDKQKEIFDISIQTSFADTMSIEQITEVLQNINFEFSAPTDLDTSKADLIQLYHIHQEDNDTYTLYRLPIKYNATKNTISFSTAKFSKFVLLYDMKSTEQPVTTKNDHNDDEQDEEEHHEEDSAPANIIMAQPKVEQLVATTTEKQVKQYRLAQTWDKTKPILSRMFVIILAIVILLFAIKKQKHRT